MSNVYYFLLMLQVGPPVYTLVLLTLAVDRARAMRDPAAYKKALARASGRHKCYVFAYWVVAAAAASPLFYFFKNWPFPDRLSCQERALLFFYQS